MKQILVSGSSASNMSIISSHYTKNHGGTGANISYNLALLWESAILLSSIWDDYEYSSVISSTVNLSYIHKQAMTHSAHSVILSDREDNKITIFHPWAMDYASSSKVEHIQETCSIAIVSANHIPTMLEHAQKIASKNIPIFIDPAQQVSQMSKDELWELLKQWTHLIANQHEFTQICDTASLSESEIISMFEYVIITRWSEWLQLFQNGNMIQIPAIKLEEFEDTTWAWDALRAGILYALTEWRNIETACKLGTVLASYCILAPGSQQHHFSKWSVMEDMKTHFWVELDLFSKRKY